MTEMLNIFMEYAISSSRCNESESVKTSCSKAEREVLDSQVHANCQGNKMEADGREMM